MFKAILKTENLGSTLQYLFNLLIDINNLKNWSYMHSLFVHVNSVDINHYNHEMKSGHCPGTLELRKIVC